MFRPVYSSFAQVQSHGAPRRHPATRYHLLPLALAFVGMVQLELVVATTAGKDCTKKPVKDPDSPPATIDEVTALINGNGICPNSSLKVEPPEYQFNQYNEQASLPVVSAYLSSAGIFKRQMDPRLFLKHYDKIILSAFVLCGDPRSEASLCGCDSNQLDSCPAAYKVASTDLQTDLDVDICGQTQSNHTTNYADGSLVTDSDKVKTYTGMLGCLRDFKNEYSGKTVAISIGGRGMSSRFTWMARSQQYRERFVASVVQMLNNFPFITQVNLDWEYPGVKSEENEASEDDGDNFADLVKDLKEALNKAGKTDVLLAVAASADVEQLETSKIGKVIAAGVDIIHLMAYDFFSTPETPKLTHHANLYPKPATGYPNSDGKYSVDSAVNYLIDTAGADPKKIHLGYAAHTRNAAGAERSHYSPIGGTYNHDAAVVGGSWESGSYEFYDVLARFIDTNQLANGLKVKGSHIQGKEYTLYTDTISNADSLYSSRTKFFISLDTPRTVYLKGQYVRKRGLGGLFVSMAGYDKGLLLNAAREGLGYGVPTQEVIKMDKVIHTCGKNGTQSIGEDECKRLTDIYDSDNDSNHNGNSNDGEIVHLLTWETTDEEGNRYQVEMQVSKP